MIDPSTVVATHLTELFKKYADQMLTRQTVQQLLDNLALQQPKLVDELVPTCSRRESFKRCFRILSGRESPFEICNRSARLWPITGLPLKILIFLRNMSVRSLARTITRPYVTDDQKFPVLSLQQSLEEKLTRGIQKSEHGSFLSLDPGFLQQFLQATSDEVKRSVSLGYHPVLLCSPAIRRHLRKLLERFLPDVAVISHNELSNSLEIRSIGIIRMDHAA